MKARLIKKNKLVKKITCLLQAGQLLYKINKLFKNKHLTIITRTVKILQDKMTVVRH